MFPRKGRHLATIRKRTPGDFGFILRFAVAIPSAMLTSYRRLCSVGSLTLMYVVMDARYEVSMLAILRPRSFANRTSDDIRQTHRARRTIRRAHRA